MDFQNQSDLQVEKIIDKKVFNGKTLYLVKWKNYPIEQATWQCNKLLINVKDKIREFKYSKRATQQIPNIKFEEDLPEGQIRDTFKRKRGRPPRLSFNSYREAANQSTQKNSQFHKTTQSLIKRGRGRPRGSKNKRPRHVHFEEQSQATFQSEQYEKSRIQDKTLINEDASNNDSEENQSKKGRKLKKIILKTKQKQKNYGMKIQKEQEFDIVDSQEQVDQEKINLNSGEKLGCSSSILIDSQDNFIQKGGYKRVQKDIQQIFLQQNLQKEIQKNFLQNSELESNKEHFVGVKQIIRKDLTKQKQLKNAETNSSQKEFRRIFIKQNKKKQKDLLEQLDQFKEKHFCENKQDIKVSRPIIQQVNHSKTQLRQLDKLKTIQVQKQKLIEPKQTCIKGSILNNQCTKIKLSQRDISSNNLVKKVLRITKIYHLQTIELQLSKQMGQHENQQFEQFSNNAFSEQQLGKMSLTRQIVDIFSDSLNFKRLSLHTKNGQKKINDNTRILYQALCSIVKDNPENDNDELIDKLRQFFQETYLKDNNQFLRRNQFQAKVQEVLYLVQFNQGKIIKKMTASDVVLYLMVDMIRSTENYLSDQCFASFLNFTFYIKFLERSLLPLELKNQTQMKIQKPTVKNIKLENKNDSHKLQLQDLLIEALKNVKKKPNLHHSNVSLQSKQKKAINFDNQINGSKFLFTQNQFSQDLFQGTQQLVSTTKVEDESIDSNM